MGKLLSRISELYRSDRITGVLEGIYRYITYRINRKFRHSLIYSQLTGILNPFSATIFALPTNIGWVVYELSNNSKFFVPNRANVYRARPEWRKFKLDRYTKEGFIEIEQDDLVVDVGAFRGEFSKPASDKASKVIAIEPDPRNLIYLIKNTDRSGVDIVQTLASDTDKMKKFNVANEGYDSSVFEPDRGQAVRKIRIPGLRLDSILATLGLSEVDFLKIDAEGFEPEVLEGINNSRIKKIAVDVSPERHGRSPRDEIAESLKSQGYSVKITDSSVVLGKL